MNLQSEHKMKDDKQQNFRIWWDALDYNVGSVLLREQPNFNLTFLRH